MVEKKLVIFDFDGVLLDTLFVCHSIDEELFGGNSSVQEYQALFDGNIFSAPGHDKKIVNGQKFERMYEERTREICVPIELQNFVRKLSDQTILAIVSSTPTASIKNILARENIEDCFTDVLGSDIALNKAVKIRSLLAKYSIMPFQAIFITDTRGDMREGKECDVRAIAVTWGFQTREMLEKNESFAVVDTVAELETATNSFLKEPKN